MQPSYPLHPDRCAPLRIVESGGTPNVYGFLGGAPPRGVAPEAETKGMRFFASVPIPAAAEQKCASIFVAPFEVILAASGKLSTLGPLDVTVHEQCPRGPSTVLDAEISASELERLPEIEDVNDEDDSSGERAPYSGHKIGGRPYLVWRRPELLAAMDEAYDRGYRLVLQIDFPAAGEAPVSGNWPFGTGIFALLGKTPFGSGRDWLWYWDS